MNIPGEPRATLRLRGSKIHNLKFVPSGATVRFEGTVGSRIVNGIVSGITIDPLVVTEADITDTEFIDGMIGLTTFSHSKMAVSNDDLGKIPLDLVGGVNNYKQFLNSSFPRAFAVSATRQHWAWNTGANDVSEALRRCAERAGQACTLYAVDETVVYRP